MMTIHLLLVDDCATFRLGLRRVFEQMPDIVVVGEAGTGEDALAQIETLKPDVVLLDCRMPGMEGMEVAAAVKRRACTTNILALSAYDDDKYVRGMLNAGAVGYLLKDETPERIVEAVRAAARGESWFSPKVAKLIVAWACEEETSLCKAELTKQECVVLRLLAKGKSNDQIANELCISERTVRFHLRNICDKIGTHSDRQAAIWAIQHGFGKEQ